MQNYFYISTIFKKNSIVTEFFVDKELEIDLHLDWDSKNNRISRFELLSRKQSTNVYEIKEVKRCKINSGNPIFVIHILKNGKAKDQQRYPFKPTELRAIQLENLYDRELFVFVIHNDASYKQLIKTKDYCNLNQGIPETKDGTIIISI